MNKKTDDTILLKAAQSGDKSAEDALVLRYRGYVEMLTRPYFLAGAEREDINQIGLIGLVRAIRSFDTESGNSFKTYAARCIRNAVVDGVREAGSGKNSALNSSVSLPDEDSAEKESPTQIAAFGDPEEQYIAKEAEKAFFDALCKVVGDDNLEIIKLYLSSVPYKEISKKLGVTAKKVDNTIYAVKKKLQKLLKDYDKNN